MEKLRVFTIFSGYGSQEMALRNIGLPFEMVGMCEWANRAIIAYDAIHGENNYPYHEEVSEEEIIMFLTSLGISSDGVKQLTEKQIRRLNSDRRNKIYNSMIRNKNIGSIIGKDPKEIPQMDLLTYSFPCQDISNDGNKKGMVKGSGTRSSLLWEVEGIIKEKLPKYLFMENVKGLLNKHNFVHFQEWVNFLEDLNYTNYYKILNSNNFGIPQNRERVFMISIRGDHAPYIFPDGKELEKKLLDFLEDDVEERFFLEEYQVQRLMRPPHDIGSLRIMTGNQKGYIEAHVGDGVSIVFPSSKTRRGRVKAAQAHTLCAKDCCGVLVSIDPPLIRRLTPLESARLMGLTDEDYNKMKDNGITETDIYILTGNSIVVPIMEDIFKNLFLNECQAWGR